MPDLLPIPFVLDARLSEMFGAAGDPMSLVEARSLALFPGHAPVVWEGDPETFRFSYVSASVEPLLGWPPARWTGEPTFWADQVVHAEDRTDAVAYCALATARARDHVFEYRARASDGRVLWLRDIVKVIVGRRGIPTLLRGVMFDVTAEKAAMGVLVAREPTPSRAELQSA